MEVSSCLEKMSIIQPLNSLLYDYSHQLCASLPLRIDRPKLHQLHLSASKKTLLLDIPPRMPARHSNSFHVRSNMTGVCTEWHKISSKYIRGCSEHSKYFMKNIKIFIDSLCAWFLCLLSLLFFRHNSVRNFILFFQNLFPTRCIALAYVVVA